MKLKRILLFSLILLQINAFSQVVYNVNVDDRNKAIVLYNQADILIKENKLNEAYSNLVDAISIDSTFRPSYLILYKISLLNNDYLKTVGFYLKKGIRIFTEDDELSFYLGEIYRLNSDPNNAFIAYSSAINLNKTNGEDKNLVHLYYFNRANCFLKKNLIDSAMVDYSEALKLKPDFSFAFLNRGTCFFKKGKKKEACSDWEKSLGFGCASAKEYITKYCNK